jgi:hypothetical protein
VRLSSRVRAVTTVYNRFNRWSHRGFWLKLLDALVGAGAVTKSTAIDSTYVKAQRAAFGAKGGARRKRSAARVVAGRPRSTRLPYDIHTVLTDNGILSSPHRVVRVNS